MDPSFYFQNGQNPALLQKMAKIMSPEQMPNLKPGFSYPENELLNYNQMPKQVDPQMDLYRNSNTFNYPPAPEQFNQHDYYQNQTKPLKNFKGTNTITDVWKYNLEEEFIKIMDIIEEYPLIALVIYFDIY